MNRKSPFASAAVAENNYRVARGNLLLVVIFTAINIVLSMVNASIYFLFSASIPYYAAVIGAQSFYAPAEGEAAMPVAFMIVMGVIGLVLTVPYLLCWIFSKKHRGWMIAALVLFSLDTVALFLLFDPLGMIFDILFHAWVLVYLIMGVRNAARLNKGEAEAAAAEASVEADFTVNETSEGASAEAAADGTEAYTPADETPEDSLPIRAADFDVAGKKVRVYLQASVDDLFIVYRRVAKTEQLVINDVVYAELENPKDQRGWSMSAVLHGRRIEAGVVSGANLIVVNDQVIARSTRWF